MKSSCCKSGKKKPIVPKHMRPALADIKAAKKKHGR